MWIFLLACNGDKVDTASNTDPDDTETDTEDTSPECEEDGDCDGGEICDPDECVEGDRNNSPEEAESIVWDATVEGVLNPSGDVDWYTFLAEGGEYVRVQTAVEGEEHDTVLTIRDAAGKVVTSADAFATGTGVTGVDAVAFAYLESAGAYTITVEDVDTAGGGNGYGTSEYVYTLIVQEWSDSAEEVDSAEDPSFTFTIEDERVWSSAGVLIGEPGDQDFLGVDFTLGSLNLYVDGNEDLTGSDLEPRVRLLGTDGTVYGAKDNVGPDDYLLYPHLPLGDYVIEVSDIEGGGSSSAWTFAHVIARADSDGYEFVEASEPNETVDAATTLEPTAFTNDGGADYSLACGQGTLDAVDDEDWFALTTDYEEGGMVLCLSSSVRGSLVAPDVQLYDAEGTLLREVEGDAGAYPNANLDNVDVDPGTYYLRVRAEETPGGPGSWYRFHWFTASFSVADFADGGYSCP